MNLIPMILETLKQYSSEENTFTRESLVERLQEDYPENREFITSKTVRTQLDDYVNVEQYLPDEQKKVLYREYAGGKRKTDYYYNNSFSDYELKFMIDSVLFSPIFPSEKARNLAKKIQSLSGKKLQKLTPYINSSFGKQRCVGDTDVLGNLEVIVKAVQTGKWIAFDWHVYDVADKKVELRKIDRRMGKPVDLILNNGRYYLFLLHEKNPEKVYTYSVDLMKNIEMVKESRPLAVQQKKVIKAEYSLTHPFMMGGEVRRYRLLVKREYLSRVVDDFSYEMKILKETDEVAEVMVRASRKGMLYWLLQHYDMAELAGTKDEELLKELEKAVRILNKKYRVSDKKM